MQLNFSIFLPKVLSCSLILTYFVYLGIVTWGFYRGDLNYVNPVEIHCNTNVMMLRCYLSGTLCVIILMLNVTPVSLMLFKVCWFFNQLTCSIFMAMFRSIALYDILNFYLCTWQIVCSCCHFFIVCIKMLVWCYFFMISMKSNLLCVKLLMHFSFLFFYFLGGGRGMVGSESLAIDSRFGNER